MNNSAILAYLTILCKKLVLSGDEKEKIHTSVNSIKERLVMYFSDDGLKEVKLFGSFDRNTLLSRNVNPESDVDILIVFEEAKWQPQTYLSKLKKFAEDYYPRSEKYQDHPTISIELNHIKFELIPCIYRKDSLFREERYLIPIKEDAEWISTVPNSIKNKIDGYHKTKSELLNLILIFKYWNILNSSPFKTIDVEEFIIDNFDHEEGLDYNFFRIIDKLHFLNYKKEQNNLNRKTKQHKQNIELLIGNRMEEYALLEIQKIVPDI